MLFKKLMKMAFLSLRMSSMKLTWKDRGSRNCRKMPKLLGENQKLSRKSFRKGEQIDLIILTIFSMS